MRRLTEKVNAVMTHGHPALWPELRDRLINLLLHSWAGSFTDGTRIVALSIFPRSGAQVFPT